MAIYVLAIEHKHGVNISLHRTESGADAALCAYVAEWWPTQIDDESMPSDKSAARDRYFDLMCDSESYILEPYELQD